jgi:uncharacterized membrane protein YkvA (DUF1232 family)
MRNSLTGWLQKRPIHPEDYVGDDEARNEQVVREGFVAKAKRYLRQIPMATEVVAAYFCMLDPQTPLWVKGVAAAALAYFILPADAIPDLLPIVGLSDDISILTAALSTISIHITDEHRQKARQWMEHERIIA